MMWVNLLVAILSLSLLLFLVPQIHDGTQRLILYALGGFAVVANFCSFLLHLPNFYINKKKR